MFREDNTFTSYPFLLLILLSIFLFPATATAAKKMQPDSIITLPIQADLSVLEKYLNAMVPNILADIDEPDKVCIKAQYFKIKGIPKCRRDGFMISCEKDWLKIKTLPEIKCTVKGWVKRDGQISVSGEGKTLHFTFPVKTQVSTKAGIRATANASAVLYIHATPRINKDWSISVDVAPYFSWSQTPTVTLMETIKINIKNKVEPKLRKKINLFIKKIPQLLADLKMQTKVNTAWQDIQEPFKLSDDSETYLLFKPNSASYSGFNIVDNIIHTTISAKGKTEIILGKPNVDYKKTKLCKLGSIPCQEGKFNFHLPVSISYPELLKISNKKILNEYSIDLIKNTIPGILKISNPRIEKHHSGKIRITAHINYDNRSEWLKMVDIFNWFDVDGEITFKGSPSIDKNNKCLVLDNLVYDSTTSSDLFDLLVDTAKLQPIQSYLGNIIEYKFGQKINEGIIKANKALKTVSKDELSMSAYLQMASIEDILLTEKHITINTKLSGRVNANIGL